MIEPTTLRERYARAMSSSHLELTPHRRGDIEIIMAAGGAGMPDSRREDGRTFSANAEDRRLLLASSLVRLMAEYDEVRGQRAVARRNYEAADTKDHARIEATTAINREAGQRARRGEAPMEADELRACVARAAEAMRDQIAHDARMAHAFVLMRLKSLATTRQEFGEWAMQMAIRRRFMDCGPMPMIDPERSGLVGAWRKGKRAQQTVVLALAGRVLDLVLDPNCYRCEGRGFNGGYDRNPQRICNDMRKGGCGGSGKRSTKIGKTKEEDDFAGYLLTEVEIMLARVTREMRERLRDKAPALAMAAA